MSSKKRKFKKSEKIDSANNDKSMEIAITKTEIILGDFSMNPTCSHGPAVLFSRNGENFYACSAYRSRKLCSFYMSQELWLRKKQNSQLNANEIETTLNKDIQDSTTTPSVQSLSDRKKRLKSKTEDEISTIVPYKKKQKMTNQDSYLDEKTNNKGQAQYLFSKQTLSFIVNLLQEDLKLKKVICLGVPTLHSYILQQKSGNYNNCNNLESYLLDIDIQFKGVKNFSLFNMCNNYYFEEKYKSNYFEFLENCNSSSSQCQDELVIICDPPFGARLELVLNTIQCIESDWRDITQRIKGAEISISAFVKVILIHPYFSEGKILKINPTLKMCDYKIEYESHKKFKNGTKSPVRLFTNIPLEDIQFTDKSNSSNNDSGSSISSDYKYCPFCSKYVFKISKHCKICNSCNSKDGRLYKHCTKCIKCVKESWTHCLKCSTCHFPGNKCKFIAACKVNLKIDKEIKSKVKKVVGKKKKKKTKMSGKI